MSGQYPVGYNSPVGGHRGNFSNQIANMNQIVHNQIGMINAGILPQQTQQQANAMGQLSGPNLNNPGIQMPSYSSVQQNNPQMQQSLVQQQSQPQNPQQQQLSLQTASVPNSMVVPTQQTMQQQPQSSMLSAPKEISIVGLSRLGQETVQDIASRFQEIFSALKTMQPTCNREGSTEKKVQEYFRTIRLLFKRLRIIYAKCNDGYPQGMEYTHVESLIPYKDEPDHRAEATQCEEYRKALQENRELIETVMFKNKQLREIIDRTRIIIWEINTMLTMRRS